MHRQKTGFWIGPGYANRLAKAGPVTIRTTSVTPELAASTGQARLDPTTSTLATYRTRWAHKNRGPRQATPPAGLRGWSLAVLLGPRNGFKGSAHRGLGIHSPQIRSEQAQPPPTATPAPQTETRNGLQVIP